MSDALPPPAVDSKNGNGPAATAEANGASAAHDTCDAGLREEMVKFVGQRYGADSWVVRRAKAAEDNTDRQK